MKKNLVFYGVIGFGAWWLYKNNQRKIAEQRAAIAAQQAQHPMMPSISKFVQVTADSPVSSWLRNG